MFKIFKTNGETVAINRDRITLFNEDQDDKKQTTIFFPEDDHITVDHPFEEVCNILGAT